MKDFFISYNKNDKAWAEWIAWTLEDAGYTTVIQAWDFLPGSNFVLNMQQALEEAETTIAVISRNYFESVYTRSEWATAFANDPTGITGKLIPVRIDNYKPKGLFAQIVYINLTDSNDDSASKLLLKGIRKKRGKPEKTPNFPGPSKRRGLKQPKFPGKTKRQKRKVYLAVIVTIIILFSVSYFYMNLRTERHLNPEPKLAIASKYYFLEDLKKTANILKSVAEDKNLNKEQKRACLAFFARVLVEDDHIDEAKKVINRLLDLEPPLITIYPSQKHRKLQTVYENVRESRFNYAEDRSQVKAIAIYEFQTYNTPRLKDYLYVGNVVQETFTNIMAEKYTVVERIMLGSILEELNLDPISAFKNIDRTNYLKKLNEVIEPWVLLREPTNWNKDETANLRLGKLIEATHYIFGEVIFKPSLQEHGKQKAMIMVWMYNVDTAQLRLTEHIQGDISELPQLLGLSEHLAKKVNIAISNN
jgi:hypothetical protein